MRVTRFSDYSDQIWWYLYSLYLLWRYRRICSHCSRLFSGSEIPWTLSNKQELFEPKGVIIEPSTELRFLKNYSHAVTVEVNVVDGDIPLPNFGLEDKSEDKDVLEDKSTKIFQNLYDFFIT